MPTLTEGGREARDRVLSILGRLAMQVPGGVIDGFDWDACAERTGSDALAASVSGPPCPRPLSREDWQRDIDERTADSMVPERYRSAPVDVSYEGTLERGQGLYISGVMGSGKTYKSVAILRGWLSRNRGKALFATSTQIMAEINATFSNTDTVLEVADRYGRCPLLVIDDLGKETPTEHTVSMLWHILNTRYSWGLPTVITSQYSLPQLAARLGGNGNGETAGAIVSRIRETSVGVSMGTVDRRVAGNTGR